MTGSLNPAEMRAYIVERLVGDTGEPDHVILAARALAERALGPIRDSFDRALATPVRIDVNAVELARLAEARPGREENGAMAVISSPSSPDALVVTADSRAIAILVAAFFGGDPELPVEPIERSLSPTELEVTAIAFQELAKAVNGSGTRSFDFHFPMQAPLAGTQLAEKVMRDGPAARIDLSVACGPSIGRLSLFMPQRVLLKHRGDAAPSRGDGKDTEWGARFGEEVMRSSIGLQATMPLARMALADLACLQVGQVLELREGAQSQVKLSARHKTLFVCEFGKLGQNYTVRVKNSFDARQDLIDGLVER
ncbi:FliM/FliN family flagellar motor switch protein [Pseudaminobacter sp. 19-2017]|uniref:Flagellar motor switch protein FliM n=1 Tax=Pseudaminobacter soli (ex Zhang et al. 2022) TaxID=2831468 RepID=A0A942E3I7_9HYPH|nr:FliM/FliN family flagellar motor switch protein [Pseudaminobacter soli]MBS3650321.1 FliM/FliN family flagellar motor switch protein [Pseudaminobacter soli]